MRDPKPVTRTMNISVVKNSLSSVVNDVFRTDSRIVVEKSGIPVAAIISADDLARLAQFEQEREERFRAVDRARAAFADVPSDEIEQATDRIIARNRDGAMADPTPGRDGSRSTPVCWHPASPAKPALPHA